ncbi:MAG: flagellar motor switch protein FliG [Oligoflexales bacterium]
MSTRHFTPYQKIAALLLSFGKDIAAQVLKQMSKEEVKKVTRALQDLGQIEKIQIDELSNEFYQVLQSEDIHLKGGKRKTIELLKHSFKGEKGESLAHEIENSNPQLEAVNLATAKVLSTLISNEHPQTIAIVIAFCDPIKAGQVLKLLPESLHSEVFMRIANLDTVSAEIVEELDETLKKQIEERSPGNQRKVGGIEQIVGMLNKQDSKQREIFLIGLEERDPQLVQAVRERLFTFSHLLKLSDKDLQSVLSHINRERLKVALAGESRKLVEKFMLNMSKRSAESLHEDLENRKKLRKSEVAQAQQEILTKIKLLADQGVISLFDETV